MTPSKEDYIKSIFKQVEESGYASNKELSYYLGISRPSVSEMIKKLKEEEYVVTEGRKVFLSQRGEEMAKKTLTIHRLWETFLQTKLNYDPSQIHNQADLLEHVTSDQLLEDLNRFLGYPKTCPHGGVIYGNEDKA